MGNLDYFNHHPDTGIFSGLRPLPGKEGWPGCAVLHVSGTIFLWKERPSPGNCLTFFQKLNKWLTQGTRRMQLTWFHQKSSGAQGQMGSFVWEAGVAADHCRWVRSRGDVSYSGEECGFRLPFGR